MLLQQHVGRIAQTSFFLGCLFALCMVGILHSVLLSKNTELYAFSLYFLVAHVFFHFAEFLVPIRYRPTDISKASFLIFHSTQYLMMSGIPFVEFLVKLYLLKGTVSFFPLPFKLTAIQCTVCAFLAAFFYGIRIVSMVQCGTNFSLAIENNKRNNHQLVKHGIYSVLRHPSYFGFFWRTLFLQLLLGNMFTFIIHTWILWRFFRCRIKYEESLLESEGFFGSSYKNYKMSTFIGIPFI